MTEVMFHGYDYNEQTLAIGICFHYVAYNMKHDNSVQLQYA